MQKQGIFTSLGEHRRATSRKRDNDTSRQDESHGGMSFRYKGDFPPSTQKNSEGNPNGSVNASPIKIDYASSGKSPMSHIQFGTPSQTFQPGGSSAGFGASQPLPQYSQSHPIGILQRSVASFVHQHPHPNAIRTIIQTPVPIINPVIIQQTASAKEEIESLEQQREVLLDQYRKLYEQYEELKSKPHEPSIPPERAPTRPKEPARATMSKHRIAVMETQLSALFREFETDMNAAIDRIIGKCQREGSEEISRIAASSLPQIRYG